jgi:hypothetical protein
MGESAIIPLFGHFGAAQIETGDLVGGIATLREMLERVERDAGAEHPRTMAALHELAQALRLLDRIDESEALFRRGYALAIQAHGPDAWLDLGQRTEARALMTPCAERLQNQLSPEHANARSAQALMARL